MYSANKIQERTAESYYSYKESINVINVMFIQKFSPEWMFWIFRSIYIRIKKALKLYINLMHLFQSIFYNVCRVRIINSEKVIETYFVYLFVSSGSHKDMQ